MTKDEQTEPTCDLCAGECRGHSLGHPEEWEPEPGSHAAPTPSPVSVEQVARAVESDPTEEPRMPGLSAHFPETEYHGGGQYTVKCDCGFKSGKPENYYVAKARWAEHAALSIEEQGWQTILERLANRAAFVMQMLEEDGPKVVPHLIDTDDNPGQYLRDAIEDARAFLSSNKRES